MSDISLYGVTDDIRAIIDTLDSIEAVPELAAGEAPPEGWKEANDARMELQLRLDEAIAAAVKKGDGFIAYLRQLDSWATAAKAESKRLADRARAAEKRQAKLKDYARMALENAGLKKIECSLGTMSLRQNPPSVQITNPEMVPAAFKVVIPATEQISKSDIARAIKAGQDVPGADLIPGGTSLLVK